MADPVASWVFEAVGPLLWLLMLIRFGYAYRRDRILSVGALVFLSATTMWWQEWYGDWGSYLLYNPQFKLLPWRSSLWTTPNKPWAVIPAYGWYFTIIFPGMLWLIGRVRRSFPQASGMAVLLGVTIPLFYVFDLIVEGVAAELGWWSYTNPIGPALRSSHGSFPLVFPILLFVLFGVVATLVLDRRDDRGRHGHERLLGVTRMRPGWRQEGARALSWVVLMNGLYWSTLMGPLIVLRTIFGSASSVVP